ncbi:MAG: prolyl oligopeptidase family serine peptidase [Candidatus Acidiferrales bacterium]
MRKIRNQKRVLILAAGLCCGVAVAGSAAAQEPKPLVVEDALNNKQFAALLPLSLSPDGKDLAYTVQDNGRARRMDLETYDRTGIPPWGVGSDIWVRNTESAAERNLTAGDGDNWLPVWSPDGRYLAFLSDRGGTGQARLWIWDKKDNQLRKVSDANVHSDELEWTRDSQQLLVTVLPEGLTPEQYASKLSLRSTSEKQKEREISSPSVILYQGSRDSTDREKHPQADPWNLDQGLRDLISIDARTGKAKTLTHGARITSYLLSPDGSQIVYTIPKRFEKPGSQQILYDIALVGSGGGDGRTVAADIPLNFNAEFSWSPDSTRISYRESGPYRSGDFYVVTIQGGSPENVAKLSVAGKDLPSGPVRPLWDAQGDSIFFIQHGELWQASLMNPGARKVGGVQNRQIIRMIPRSGSLLWTLDDGTSTVVIAHDDTGKQDGFYRIDLRSGESTRLLEQGQCYTCSRIDPDVTVSGDGQKIFYFREDARHSSELWTTTAAFDNQRQLSNVNPQFEKYEMGAARLVQWLSDDGEQLRGALLLPANYQEGKRYPLIAWVYGGSLLSDDLDHFGVAGTGTFNMQLFATRGYAVLLPDSPQEPGTPMADLAKTVLPGVNKVIEMGIADPDRLGVAGQSNGGYSTLALIVQTKRFKAAMEADGFADLIGMYSEMDQAGTAFGTSNLEHGQDGLGGTPWEVGEKFVENSPIYYLDRVETPLLIVHGSNDITVAPFLGDELFVDMRRLGKEVEYAKYEGEDHSSFTWSYPNQVDYCNRMIAWFEKYLKGDSPKSSSAGLEPSH